MSEKLSQMKQLTRRIFLDSSTPSNWAVVRIVLVAFVAWYLASFLVSIVISLKPLIFLLILSVFFAYLLNPLVSYVRLPFKNRNIEKFMPRTLAILIVYLFVFSTLGILISWFAPRVAEQARKLASNIPFYAETIRQEISQINQRYESYRIPEEIQVEINKKVNELGMELAQSITSFIGDTAISVVTYLPWLVIIPIFSFFFLKDANSFRIWVLRSFPQGLWRDRVEAFLEDVNQTLSAYVRAQLVSCIFIGFLCTTGFYFLGLNYSLLLGILAGIFEFVPLIGPLVIGLTATVVAGITDSFQTATYTAIFLIALRIFHDYVTYPKIVRGGIHLPPVIIILSILVGEKLAGVAGVFLAIPITALLIVLYKHILEHRKSKGFFSELLNEKTEAEQ
ncbi:MAG: AI-2E family transporter [Pyrinomonadaceae bacterium]|nr:AI-2E family transporter [Pyrinomonadaceae bacterium]MDW8303462.1 AI-2E family transporter [Acidobacteriota bacterium]